MSALLPPVSIEERQARALDLIEGAVKGGLGRCLGCTDVGVTSIELREPIEGCPDSFGFRTWIETSRHSPLCWWLQAKTLVSSPTAADSSGRQHPPEPGRPRPGDQEAELPAGVEP